MSDTKLRELLDFDEDDLRANQNGKVSDKQKQRLAKRRNTDSSRWIIVFLALLVIPAALLVWLLSSGSDLVVLFKTYAVPIILISFVVLYVGIVLFSSIFGKRDDTLKSLQGEVEYVRVERQEKDYARSDSSHDMHTTVQVYELHLGGVTCGDVNKAMMDVIKQGDIYKVYYTQDGGILSAELVKKGK